MASPKNNLAKNRFDFRTNQTRCVRKYLRQTPILKRLLWQSKFGIKTDIIKYHCGGLLRVRSYLMSQTIQHGIDQILEVFSVFYDKLFYFPGDKADFLPDGISLNNVEKLMINTTLGDSIAVWHLKVLKPRARIIHCHGSGYNMSSHYPHVSWLAALGFEVFMFDYPGYGESTGKPTRASTVQTAQEVIYKFTDQAPSNLPVFILGQSLGGNIASVAMATAKPLPNIAGLIFDSMYSSFQELGALKIHRKFIRQSKAISRLASKLVSNRNAPIHHAHNLKLPTLIIHSRNDSVVPFTESINFYKKMTHNDVEFWSHLNSGHTEVLQNNIGDFQQRIVKWMSTKMKTFGEEKTNATV